MDSVQHDSLQPHRAIEMWLGWLRNWIFNFLLINDNLNSNLWLAAIVLDSAALKVSGLRWVEGIITNIWEKNTKVKSIIDTQIFVGKKNEWTENEEKNKLVDL